ncbi:MAG: hypothetical protein ACFE8C_00380 [Promethearchaeota archaeon]
MQKSKIEIGSFFILFMAMYIIVLSLLWIFLTEIMFVSDFAHVTGYEFSEHPDIVLTGFYIITKKLIGFILLANGSMILLINQKSFRKAEKWSWYALLIGGGVSWGTFIGYKIFIGYIGLSMITFAVGATLLVIGLAFPAKAILGNKSTEMAR